MDSSDDKNEIIAHEWTTVRTLWSTVDQSMVSAELRAEMESLLKDRKEDWSSKDIDWDRLNRAEQVLALTLDPMRLKIEYRNLLAIAKERSLPSIEEFEKYADNHVGPGLGAGGAGDPKELSAVYLALLYRLQSGFVESRHARGLRRQTAIQLLRYGQVLLAAVVCLLIAYEFSRTLQLCPTVQYSVQLLVVLAVGATGAFFSRISAFQLKFSTLRLEDINNDYRQQVLQIRILCGAIAAMLIYFLLRAELMTGALTPKFEALGLNIGSGTGKWIVEWSKLIVWSFAAGFSERLLSSGLDLLNSPSTKA